MKKIILPAMLAVASIFLFSFSSNYFKTVNMINGFDHHILQIHIAKTSDAEWGEAIEFEDEDHDLAPGQKAKITLDDDIIKEGFDVIILDEKKVWHEYNDWTAEDLKTTWELVPGDHDEKVKHGNKPSAN